MRIFSKYWFYITIAFIAAVISSFTILQLLKIRLPESKNPDISIPTTPSEFPAVALTPDFINLQPTVDEWLTEVDSNIGIIVYDLDNELPAASYQPNEIFDVASLYKLFFAYDGYRQIDTGNINGSDIYVTTNDYRAGSYSYLTCLDLIIRESYNGCADPMNDDFETSDRIANFINELELTHTADNGQASTASDLTELLKLYYHHPDLSISSWELLSDSMLNQPATIEDWRQGLPSGFDMAKVYAKVGWNYNYYADVWTSYNEAALLVFEKLGRHYSAVVLAENVTTPAIFTDLGRRLENAIVSTDPTQSML